MYQQQDAANDHARTQPATVGFAPKPRQYLRNPHCTTAIDCLVYQSTDFMYATADKDATKPFHLSVHERIHMTTQGTTIF